MTTYWGGGGGGGGALNLEYVGIGVRTTYPLAPEQRKKKPNTGRRLPRMGDARAETGTNLSHPDPRSDPNGESEPSLGRETIYWDSLPALSDIGVSKSYNYINMLYTKIQNRTTTVVVFIVSHTYSPESHLHIQKLYIYIYRSERGTYSDEPLLVCWPGRMRKITVSFFCTYTD